LHLLAAFKSTVHPGYDRWKVTNFFTVVFSEIVEKESRNSFFSYIAFDK